MELDKLYSYHEKICDVYQHNLAKNKDIVSDVQLKGAPLVKPREAVRQRDFDQTEVRSQVRGQRSISSMIELIIIEIYIKECS